MGSPSPRRTRGGAECGAAAPPPPAERLPRPPLPGGQAQPRRPGALNSHSDAMTSYQGEGGGGAVAGRKGAGVSHQSGDQAHPQSSPSVGDQEPALGASNLPTGADTAAAAAAGMCGAAVGEPTTALKAPAKLVGRSCPARQKAVVSVAAATAAFARGHVSPVGTVARLAARLGTAGEGLSPCGPFIPPPFGPPFSLLPKRRGRPPGLARLVKEARALQDILAKSQQPSLLQQQQLQELQHLLQRQQMRELLQPSSAPQMRQRPPMLQHAEEAGEAQQPFYKEAERSPAGKFLPRPPGSPLLLRPAPGRPGGRGRGRGRGAGIGAVGSPGHIAGEVGARPLRGRGSRGGRMWGTGVGRGRGRGRPSAAANMAAYGTALGLHGLRPGALSGAHAAGSLHLPSRLHTLHSRRAHSSGGDSDSLSDSEGDDEQGYEDDDDVGPGPGADRGGPPSAAAVDRALQHLAAIGGGASPEDDAGLAAAPGGGGPDAVSGPPGGPEYRPIHCDSPLMMKKRFSKASVLPETSGGALLEGLAAASDLHGLTPQRRSGRLPESGVGAWRAAASGRQSLGGGAGGGGWGGGRSYTLQLAMSGHSAGVEVAGSRVHFDMPDQQMGGATASCDTLGAMLKDFRDEADSSETWSLEGRAAAAAAAAAAGGGDLAARPLGHHHHHHLGEEGRGRAGAGVEAPHGARGALGGRASGGEGGAGGSRSRHSWLPSNTDGSMDINAFIDGPPHERPGDAARSHGDGKTLPARPGRQLADSWLAPTPTVPLNASTNIMMPIGGTFPTPSSLHMSGRRMMGPPPALNTSSQLDAATLSLPPSDMFVANTLKLLNSHSPHKRVPGGAPLLGQQGGAEGPGAGAGAACLHHDAPQQPHPASGVDAGRPSTPNSHSPSLDQGRQRCASAAGDVAASGPPAAGVAPGEARAASPAPRARPVLTGAALAGAHEEEAGAEHRPPSAPAAEALPALPQPGQSCSAQSCAHGTATGTQADQAPLAHEAGGVRSKTPPLLPDLADCDNAGGIIRCFLQVRGGGGSRALGSGHRYRWVLVG